MGSVRSQQVRADIVTHALYCSCYHKTRSHYSIHRGTCDRIASWCANPCPLVTRFDWFPRTLAQYSSQRSSTPPPRAHTTVIQLSNAMSAPESLPMSPLLRLPGGTQSEHARRPDQCSRLHRTAQSYLLKHLGGDRRCPPRHSRRCALTKLHDYF